MQPRVKMPLAILALALALALSVLVVGCFDPFSYGTRAGGGAVPEGVTYQVDVYPLLLSYCSTCHSAGGAAATSGFVLSSDATSDYDGVVSLVSEGDPDSSTLLQKASGQTAHAGSGVLAESSVEFKTLAAWVEQGASNE